MASRTYIWRQWKFLYTYSIQGMNPKDTRKDLDDWTPHRTSVQALKEAKIVQSVVPVVENMSYQEWLEHSGFAHSLDVSSNQSSRSPSAFQGSPQKVLCESDDAAILFARLENESTRRREVEHRLESMRKHHEKERKMLLEQAKAGQSALQEAMRLEKSFDSRSNDIIVAQLRNQLASARALSDSRTQEVQQLLMVTAADFCFEN